MVILLIWYHNLIVPGFRGAETTLKLGGGGQTFPGVQGNPTQILNSPDLAHYFLGENQVHVQKQTKIKMNDIDSPKLGGGAPTTAKLWGQVAPTAPGSRVPAWIL